MNENYEILIVDDEEVILNAICKIAYMEGYQCDKCNNAESALKKLEKNTYGLVISDIMMPDIDGFELLRRVRKKRFSVPIVITTGYSTLENAIKALYEGAVAFIPKPFSVEEMTSVIKRGIKYGNIFNKNSEFVVARQPVSVNFIPCPPKYHRLGYDSWIIESDEGIVTVGLTDLFLKSMGMIEEIEFMKIDDTVYQGGNCLKVIDSDNYIHQLLSPVSGKILDINEKLIIHKNLIEKDPYFNGWIYKILPNNLEMELENLTPCSSDL